MIRDLFESHPDPVRDLLGRIKRFASGAAAPAIWEGYAGAGAPICLVAAGLSGSGISRALAYRSVGGELLLDSGAFGYRDRPSDMPWMQVLDTYAGIMSPPGAEVAYILPDVVGDQKQTLELAKALRPKLASLARLGHSALMPVQRGTMPISAYVREYLLAVGDIPIAGVAIPSNAAAMPVRELADLAHVRAIPHRVHFLGISRRSKPLLDRARALAAFWPDVSISADACEHRAHVGQNRSITQSRAARLDQLTQQSLEDYDDTEELPYFPGDHDEVMDALKEMFPDVGRRMLKEIYCSQWGRLVQLDIAEKRFTQQNGPIATTHSIREFAEDRFGRADI